MTEYIPQDLRNYRFIGEEAESLGRRLDSARVALTNARSTWAKQHWRQVVDRLLFQWRALPALHDGNATMTVIPRWTIDFDSIDVGAELEGYGFTDKMFDKIFRTSLDQSWDRAREARLARSQF